MSEYTLLHGDVVEQLKTLDDESVDAIVVDPPYNLAFMGKKWDSKGGSQEFQRWCEEWGRECLRVLRTGGYLLSFGGTRTYHRMVAGLEDAGFDIRDCITWLYGTGFPKSQNISKAIDKRGGEDVSWFGSWLKRWREENEIPQKEVAKLFPSKTGNLTGCVANWELGFNLPTNEQFNLICSHFGLPFKNMEEAKREIIKKDIRYRKNDSWEANGTGMLGSGVQDFSITAPSTTLAQRWNGYGTALKPASEPIVVAQKPKEKTYITNILKHGVGAINIDGCRIETKELSGKVYNNKKRNENNIYGEGKGIPQITLTGNAMGRWPANVVLTHDERCVLDGEKVVKANGHAPSHSKASPFGGVNDSPRDERHYKQEVVENWLCVETCPIFILDSQSGSKTSQGRATTGGSGNVWTLEKDSSKEIGYGDIGGASRFFYCSKPSQKEKNAGLESIQAKPIAWSNQAKAELKRGNDDFKHKNDGTKHNKVEYRKNIHPTVKPVKLLEWLITLVCPSAEAMQRQPIVLDCFVGSGTTGIAAQRLGVDFIGIDANEEYLEIAKARIEYGRDNHE